MFRTPSHVRIGAIAAVLAVLTLTTGCGQKRPPRNTANAVVPVVHAAVGSISPESVLSGTIAPLQNVAITSTLTEPADSVPVSEGQHVTQGQLLAQLDTADLQAEYNADLATAQSDQAKVSSTFDQAGLTISQNSNTVNAAQAAVRAAQQTLKNDQLTLTRDASLLKQGYIAQSQYDLQATTVKNDQQTVNADRVTVQNDLSQVKVNGTTSTGLQGATVAAARADAQTAIAQAQQVKVSIDKARIVSPINGYVINRNLNVGEFPGTRQLFTLQETDHVYAILNGAASQIVGIANGTNVQLQSSSLPGKSVTGKVVGILNAVTPGTTNFVVKVEIDNARGLLRPGMVVGANAALPGQSGIRIPVTAFTDTTNSMVQTVQDGTIHTTKVTMLGEDSKNAIVSGLSPGQVVVSNGQLGLQDQQQVTIAGGKQVAQQ